MQVLIVEDDLASAELLREMVELDRLHLVTAIASDLRGALEAIDQCQPQIALIDLDLGGGSTGIEVAARARERNVPSLFTTASPLPFPVPEVALGCLCKPFGCYSIAQSLIIAQDIIGGAKSTHDVPPELELY